jgi:hypothetical protein
MMGRMLDPKPTLSRARSATSARLRGMELPDCFASATVAAEAHLLARRTLRRGDAADLRRAADKARRLEGSVRP